MINHGHGTPFAAGNVDQCDLLKPCDVLLLFPNIPKERSKLQLIPQLHALEMICSKVPITLCDLPIFLPTCRVLEWFCQWALLRLSMADLWHSLTLFHLIVTYCLHSRCAATQMHSKSYSLLHYIPLTWELQNGVNYELAKGIGENLPARGLE